MYFDKTAVQKIPRILDCWYYVIHLDKMSTNVKKVTGSSGQRFLRPTLFARYFISLWLIWPSPSVSNTEKAITRSSLSSASGIRSSLIRMMKSFMSSRPSKSKSTSAFKIFICQKRNTVTVTLRNKILILTSFSSGFLPRLLRIFPSIFESMNLEFW